MASGESADILGETFCEKYCITHCKLGKKKEFVSGGPSSSCAFMISHHIHEMREQIRPNK